MPGTMGAGMMSRRGGSSRTIPNKRSARLVSVFRPAEASHVPLEEKDKAVVTALSDNLFQDHPHIF